jgi:hypothetical protein
MRRHADRPAARSGPAAHSSTRPPRQPAVALASAVGNRRMARLLASGAVLQRQPVLKDKPKTAPPVAGGNLLYVGMNNFAPEVKALNQRYKGTSVNVTTISVTTREARTRVGGATFDLTGAAGIEAFAKSLPLTGTAVDEVKALLTSQSQEDRDDLAHVIAVYAATESDGADRMSRVVLSGHSYGTKVYNENVKGAIQFDALVKLASIFPKAAGQTKHLLVLACLAGAEDLVKNIYTKAFPNLRTWWGWTNSCPTGWGAVQALNSWSKLTDADPTKLPLPPSGQANWAVGAYQSDNPVDGPALMAGLRADEPKFDKYFRGESVDPDNHSGFLFEYYRRARTASQSTSTITGADHDYAQLHADQSFRLRFWPAMVSNFWKKNKAAIAKGYGTATPPDYGTMTRKQALAAIAAFAAASGVSPGADRAEAMRLLTALERLDAVELSDNWLTP